ncbi:hypothetical protein Pmani_036026 [Petrolisthes manimaculis]|uniref:Uncharacterized protein n=1 Tax=Petrolisthes manimaculis TaxID=1843537 RepID=A0AAE1TMT0_9EUCA|nr:hypothetical protein Pmani_036026 [Petrolisthes manimaculis]
MGRGGGMGELGVVLVSVRCGGLDLGCGFVSAPRLWWAAGHDPHPHSPLPCPALPSPPLPRHAPQVTLQSQLRSCG